MHVRLIELLYDGALLLGQAVDKGFNLDMYGAH